MRPALTLTPAHCRAARALLDWTQVRLAEKAQVSSSTVADFERGYRDPHPRTLRELRAVLVAEGIQFIAGKLRTGVVLIIR